MQATVLGAQFNSLLLDAHWVGRIVNQCTGAIVALVRFSLGAIREPLGPRTPSEAAVAASESRFSCARWVRQKSVEENIGRPESWDPFG